MSNMMDSFMENDGGYVLDDDSDDNKATDSSDSEIDILLTNLQQHGAKKKVMTKFRVEQRKQSSSEDEFEKEMSAELSATVSAIEQKHDIKVDGKAEQHNDPDKFYDNVYFDSDSDEENTKQEKESRKRPVISNDDLLYDPNMDDDDQRWVDARRRQYQLHPSRGKSNKKAPGTNAHAKIQSLPSSDAVLNCPACMTTLCLDCQRHDTYNNQYRAMFVQHCKVNTSEELSFPTNAKLKKKQRRNKKTVQEPVGNGSGSEKYHPVHCDVCNTEVGVYDQEEVYHFFNVLASYT